MPLIVAHHPTYAFFHNPYEWGAFEADLARFARMISGTLRPGPQLLLTYPTVEDVQRMAENPVVAVDIETAPETPSTPWTGKDPTRARLRTVGLGTDSWGLSHKWEGGLLVEAEIARVLADVAITKLFHNGFWFDIPVLRRYGLEVA